MKQNQISTGRRSFLKAGSLAAVSAALTGSVGNAAAQGAKVDEKDAQAQSLGYKHDATKVDKAKFPKYQVGQTSGQWVKPKKRNDHLPFKLARSNTRFLSSVSAKAVSGFGSGNNVITRSGSNMARESCSRYISASHTPASIAASATLVIMMLNLRDILYMTAQ